MKRVLLILFLLLALIATFIWFNLPKITPYYMQLTKPRVGMNLDLQPQAQKNAHFVGSSACKECHKEKHRDWHTSMHAKIVQKIDANASAVVADFSKLPLDADFTLSAAVYTIGSKYKQNYMIPATINGKEDFRLGNYLWNNEDKKWQIFNTYEEWYARSYPNTNQDVPTSKACDGCHFTGFMSTGKPVEAAISCESCHGPASEHVENPKSPMFKASMSDPIRTNEVCLQCHMRNRDKRIETHQSSPIDLWMEAKDYPEGYEPGHPLIHYKLPSAFSMGEETDEFWANGAAKKNRSQGNEYVHDSMYKHGITCINCHNPHTLSNTSDAPMGNDACMKCHALGSMIGPQQDTLEQHTHHKEDSTGSLCIECHMPRTAKYTKKSPFTVRSHLFKFTYPAQTKAYGMPPETNACYNCHKDKTLDTLQSNLKQWNTHEWRKLELPNLHLY